MKIVRPNSAGDIMPVLILVITFLLSGCWVSMPAKRPKESAAAAGETYSLKRDILIVSYFTRPLAWEITRRERIGSNQRVICSLKAGDEIAILSYRSFRMPAGVEYAYRCKHIATGLIFDLGLEMQDCLQPPTKAGPSPRSNELQLDIAKGIELYARQTLGQPQPPRLVDRLLHRALRVQRRRPHQAQTPLPRLRKHGAPACEEP